MRALQRFAVQARATKELYEKLLGACAATGRSLAAEIEHRLERSFQEMEVLKIVFGRDDTITLVQTIASFVNALQDLTRRSWTEDADTRRKILKVVYEVLAAQFDAVDAPRAPHESFHDVEVRRARYLSWYLQLVAREPAAGSELPSGGIVPALPAVPGSHVPAPAPAPARKRRQPRKATEEA